MFTGYSISDIIIVIVSLLVSVGVHEAVHAYVAHSLGDDTAAREGRLTLNPLKHIDLYMTVLLPAVLIAIGLPPIFVAKPVPFDPHSVRFGEYGAALVALGGPFSNLALAALMAACIHLGVVTGDIVHIAIIFIQINISLFIFNMLPIPPLDGSRLLYAFAPEPVQRIMAQIEAMGLIVVFAIVLLLSQFISPILVTVGQAIFNFLL
jgi:Zn-dependent protease